MKTLDEIIEAKKEYLKEIINRFKEEINNNNFEFMYYKIMNIYGRPSDLIPAFTALLLKNNITPLEYMSYVPSDFAQRLPIEKFAIPDNIKEISDHAFNHCSRLVDITISKNVDRIGTSAFSGCNLISIEIPKNVTIIGAWAFSFCSKLKDVYYAGSEEDWKNIKIEQGNGLLIDATIHYNS